MQTETFRAPLGRFASIQRRFVACLLAVLFAGVCAHSANAAFEDDSASYGSNDWTGTDASLPTDCGQPADLTIDLHDCNKGAWGLVALGSGSHVDGGDAGLADMPLMMLGDAGGSGDCDLVGGSSSGSGSSSSFSVSGTSIVLPEPGMIGVICLGGLGLLARCRRNAGARNAQRAL